MKILASCKTNDKKKKKKKKRKYVTGTLSVKVVEIQCKYSRKNVVQKIMPE